MLRPRALKLAAAATEAKANDAVWITSAGHTGILTRDGATFVVALGCAVPGRMPWWVYGTVMTPDGRSADFEINEHDDEESAMAVALVFLTEAPVPKELQAPAPAPAAGSN